ncbi:MAG: hypothetical protein DRH43_01190 [Deltaproteobacteria bacterium]|nr:MAG: hypothetical protein DRH50_05825 [Deltaproteobacteria bacterium]RLC12592.1 MAG: hypothetical protein DRH43_01190 [Deltaproteobacteria bacterium]
MKITNGNLNPGCPTSANWLLSKKTDLGNSLLRIECAIAAVSYQLAGIGHPRSAKNVTLQLF